jgi:multidrug efflux system membrane fusion protein
MEQANNNNADGTPEGAGYPPAGTSEPPPRRPISRRASIIGTAIALAVIAGIGWLAWSLTHDPQAAAQTRGAGPGARGAPATTVGVATAERADLPVVVEALGTVTPIATSTVRPQVSGVLRTVHFREGQMVKAGQLLAEIDPRPFELALMQATGQRMKDEAQLENARLTLDRYRQLLALDSIARQDVDTQAALVKQLEATVIASRAQEGTARLNVGYTRISAPIGGRVGLRVVDVGNLVGSSDAEGIAVITQLAPVDVEFAVPQDQVSELQSRANEARLPVEALDRTRTTVLDSGAFQSLDNVVDTQTGTVRAKARFQNAKATLFPAQFVNVRLTLRTLPGAVVVPVTALRHGSDGDFVYVLNESERTVEQRAVTRGQATVDRVQVVKGLDAGEVVITEGADRLKDGARVTLPGDAARTPPPAAASGERSRGEGAKGPRGDGARRGNRAAAAESAPSK